MSLLSKFLLNNYPSLATKTTVFLLAVVCLFLVFVTPAHAATITAASCLRADVQVAVNSASAGDTVIMPPGTCTWTNLPNCSICYPIYITKPISLIGSGQSGPNATIIIDKTTHYSGWGTNPIRVEYTSNSASFLRFSNFSAQSDPSISVVNPSGFISMSLTGTGVNRVRIDHITFNNIYSRNLWLNGGIGVIDHCTFNSTNGAGGLLFEADHNNPNTPWSTSYADYATPDQWFVEDNTFDYTNAGDIVDSHHGARVTYRYNTFTIRGRSSVNIIGNHGCDSAYRSAMITNSYHNTFINNTGGSLWLAVQFRGGTGLVYDNTFTGSFSTRIGLTNYRSSPGCTVCGYQYSCMGASQPLCDGNSSIDGNTPGGYGYPCRDQIGRSGGTEEDGEQTFMPIYVWGNGSGAVTYCGGGSDCSIQYTYHILENRDFYNCASLTDTKSKGLVYTEYTYPHPLTLVDQTPTCTPGDLDCSGSVSVSDIQLAINVFLGIETRSEVISRSDLNNDGKTNVIDIQRIVNIVLGG